MTNLKIAIAESGYRQNWIAKRIGIDAPTLSRYVSGERALPTEVLKKIAKLLKVSQASLA